MREQIFPPGHRRPAAESSFVMTRTFIRFVAEALSRPDRNTKSIRAVAHSLALLFLAPLALHAAALPERDLGYGLVYVRVHNLPRDLPAKPPTGRVPPCVIDLR